jgi:hypothetical protein
MTIRLKLRRRAGTEGHRTYWLDADDSRGYSSGFLKVHTGKPDAPRQVDPELQHLAAMVERAPELAQALAEMCMNLRLKAPHLTGSMAAGLQSAEALLSDIASYDPARQGANHGE